MAADRNPRRLSRNITIKTPEQIEGIRRAGKMTSDILDLVAERIAVGVTTAQINEWVHSYTIEHGGVPAPLNYRGFPKSVCTSINEVICHGIPEERALKVDDIINVDVTCIVDGYFGDASRMFNMGEASPLAQRLVQVSRECLDLGMAQVKPGATFGDIGHHIQQHAEGNGFSVVRAFTGHGTGLKFHEAPEVMHVGQPGQGPVMQPNMVFTIEPMINAGGPDCRILQDGWTAVTQDGALSAQWEHTVAVTETGIDILTE